MDGWDGFSFPFLFFLAPSSVRCEGVHVCPSEVMQAWDDTPKVQPVRFEDEKRRQTKLNGVERGKNRQESVQVHT